MPGRNSRSYSDTDTLQRMANLILRARRTRGNLKRLYPQRYSQDSAECRGRNSSGITLMETLLENVNAQTHDLERMLELLQQIQEGLGHLESHCNAISCPSRRRSRAANGSNNYLTATRDSRHGQLAKDYRAIHKTLRRDLRSIPSPTPRSLGVDFLPDVGNQQFTYLFGLEMTVQERLKETLKVSPKQRKHKAKATLRKGTVPPCLNDPMTCDECSTDFTCRWWSVTATTNTGKGQVCDQCKTSRDKKAITEAHTSKLEEAFTRAKQMKLEAKQRLLQVTSLTCRQRI